METVDLLLTHATVVTMDDHWAVIPDGAIAIRGRMIIAVGTTTDLSSQYQAAETLNCAGCAVLPGLINAHCHIPTSLLRGLVADVQVDVWLFGYMFPVESTFMNPAFIRAGDVRDTIVDGRFLMRNRELLTIDEQTVLAKRTDRPFAMQIGHARYTAPADRILRFYREYFQPDQIIEIESGGGAGVFCMPMPILPSISIPL
jgi:hypothetical protein